MSRPKIGEINLSLCKSKLIAISHLECATE